MPPCSATKYLKFWAWEPFLSSIPSSQHEVTHDSCCPAHRTLVRLFLTASPPSIAPQRPLNVACTRLLLLLIVWTAPIFVRPLFCIAPRCCGAIRAPQAS